MPQIELHARFTRDTLKGAWWSFANLAIRIGFFCLVVGKPIVQYVHGIAAVGIARYPWDLGDLVIPFVAAVVLYPIIPLIASLRCSVIVDQGMIHIRTPFRRVSIPFDQIREDVWLTKERLYVRKSLLPMKNWYLVVPTKRSKHPMNDPTYCLGPFWNLSELEQTIEKINRIR